MQRLADLLCELYSQKLGFHGVVWIFDITEETMESSDIRSLELITTVFGEAIWQIAVIVTSGWVSMQDEYDLHVAALRETKLIFTYWASFIELGVRVTRFDASKPVLVNFV